MNLKKEIVEENGSIFKLAYEGKIANNKIYVEKVEKKLDDFLTNLSHSNMKRNIIFLRTILKDCEEQLLEVSYTEQNSCETINYKNTNINYYAKRSISNNYKLEIIYDIASGLNISCVNTVDNEKLIKYLNSADILELLKNLDDLANISSLKMDEDEKLLIEIYRLFYNENPDFSKKNISIKIQAMILILKNLGISLVEKYNFIIFRDGEYPHSLKLNQIIENLFPFGEIENFDKTNKLDDKIQKKVRIMGKTLLESIPSEYEIEEYLKTLSKIIYAGGDNLTLYPSNYTIKRITSYSNIPQKEVENTMKLVKKISEEITNK